MIQTLTLTNFRSHMRFEIAPQQAQFVVLHGENGAGKTNVLEAVSLLSVGRGLRGAKPEHLTQHGQPTWAVSAQVCINSVIQQVGTGLEAENSSRQVYLDGQKQKSQRALDGLLPMVWLTPRMDRLFQESATDRRKFIDRIAYNFYPNHASTVRLYEKALTERNRLIKNRTHNPDWFDLLEKQLVAHAEQLIKTRIEAINQLQQQENTGLFPAVQLSFTGQFAASYTDSVETCLQQFQDHLQQNRQEPPHFGPHRDDLQAMHLPKNTIAPLCSTGEQKAILLSILLSQARALKQHHQKAPLLLLDEVAAHLDAEKRQYLFEEIKAIGSQAWLTGTDKNYFQEILALPASVFVEKSLSSSHATRH